MRLLTSKIMLIAIAFAVVFSATSVFAQSAPNVFIDIKPGSCKNKVNIISNGLLPILILGSADFDVNTIDINSITVSAVVSNETTGPLALNTVKKPKKPIIADISSPPATPETCEEEVPDGFDDLLLRFRIRSLVNAIKSALPDVTLAEGDTITLTLTFTANGSQITTEPDTFIVHKPKKK